MARKNWYGQSIILLVLLFLACSAFTVATSGSVLSRAEHEPGVAPPPHEMPINRDRDGEATGIVAPAYGVARSTD